MAMSIISRMNIGGDPSNCAMQNGIGYYRISSNLRKADIDAGTDVVFTPGLGLTGVGAVAFMSLITGGFFCSGSSIDGGSGSNGIMNFVNLTTAALSTKAIPSTSGGVSGLYAVHGGKVVYCAINSSYSIQYSFDLPPSVAVVTQDLYDPSGGSVNVISQASIPDAVTGIMVYTVTDLRRVVFASGVNSFLLPYVLPTFTDFGGTAIRYGFQNAFNNFPWQVFDDAGNFYIFCSYTVDPNQVYGIVRVNKSTAVNSLFSLPDASIVTWSRIKASDYYALKGRLYFSSGSLGHRLYGTNVATWPPSLADFIDLDTESGTSSIKGMQVVPPFIYVLKSTGGTYDNQIIKVYDSLIDPANDQRFPSGGGKDEEAYIMSILR